MSALLADLKDFLADVPNERGVGDGMKAWAKELLHRLNAASTQNIFDVAPQQDSTFLPLARNGAIGFKVEEDGSKQAQLMTGTVGVTQFPWNVPNRPACSPSLDVAGQARPPQERGISDSQYSTISQKQRIDAEMRLIFRSSTFTTLDPADDPRFA